jgi:predicted AlkP superfamily phosphohydrolase/phosphomutase
MGLLDRWRGGTRKPRVVVLGLDGVGAPLIEALTDGGVMPRLAALRKQGTFGRMTSSLPTISNVSWAGFMTGVNPGKHGIYGFTELRRDSYALFFPNYGHVRAPTLWDVLGAHGKTSIVLNVPGTYPAKDIAGVLVSGFVAVDLGRAVRPASELAVLRRHGYAIDVDYVDADQRPDAFFAECFAALAARRRTFEHYLATPDWDCFIGVITETDRLHHYFWHVWADPTHRLHQRFLDFYAAIDATLGACLDRIDDAAPVFVVADHGHTAIEAECHPNAWLRAEGLLRFATATPKSLTELDPSSQVLVLDPGRIYLNLKGRFAGGVVRPGAEAEALLAHVSAGLLAITYASAEGGPVRRPVKAVYRREEIYDGPQLEHAPDAVAHGHDGFDLKGAFTRTELFGRSALTGMHTYDDALFCVNRPGIPTETLAITDLAPTIAALLGCRPATPMDGRVLVGG